MNKAGLKKMTEPEKLDYLIEQVSVINSLLTGCEDKSFDASQKGLVEKVNILWNDHTKITNQMAIIVPIIGAVSGIIATFIKDWVSKLINH